MLVAVVRGSMGADKCPRAQAPIWMTAKNSKGTFISPGRVYFYALELETHLHYNVYSLRDCPQHHRLKINQSNLGLGLG